MVADHKPTQTSPAQKPEERFRELVAIREKETEVRARIETARAQAQQRLGSLDAEIASKRARAMAEAQAEIRQERTRALAEAEAEARRLLDDAGRQAAAITAQVREREPALLKRLKDELLALR